MTYLITFPNVTQALKCEDHWKQLGQPGEIVSLPAELEAGCGFAFLLEAADKASVEAVLGDGDIAFEALLDWTA